MSNASSTPSPPPDAGWAALPDAVVILIVGQLLPHTALRLALV